MKVLFIDEKRQPGEGFRLVIYTDESIREIYDIIGGRSEEGLRARGLELFPDATEISKKDHIILQVERLIDSDIEYITSFVEEKAKIEVAEKLNQVKKIAKNNVKI